jgi:hypothetical protein
MGNPRSYSVTRNIPGMPVPEFLATAGAGGDRRPAKQVMDAPSRRAAGVQVVPFVQPMIQSEVEILPRSEIVRFPANLFCPSAPLMSNEQANVRCF